MKNVMLCALSALAFAAAPAWAAGGGGTGESSAEKPADAAIQKTQAAIAKQDWKQAQDIMREALMKNPGNADYHNLYAYSIRKGANPDMEEVFRHYNEALRIDPNNRNAHEYLGEAYLMTGNLAKAKEHLQVLDRLCFLSCEPYTMLKKAIADYESKQAKN